MIRKDYQSILLIINGSISLSKCSLIFLNRSYINSLSAVITGHWRLTYDISPFGAVIIILNTNAKSSSVSYFPVMFSVDTYFFRYVGMISTFSLYLYLFFALLFDTSIWWLCISVRINHRVIIANPIIITIVITCMIIILNKRYKIS